MDIVSNSPLLVASRPYRTARGAWCGLVVVKVSYLLSPTLATLATTQEVINEHDVRWEDKPDRSLFAPSDIVPFKRDVDVVLVGHAFSPGGQPVRSIMTRLCIGDIDKSIEVFSDRLFTSHGELRDGAKITRARLRYERAFGGPGTTNPVGMRHDKKDLFGSVSLANLQPPGLHVTHPNDLCETVGYGPIAPEWPVRANRLGHLAPTFAVSNWYENVLPDEIDPSFFNVAPLDQRLREVRPDERILLEGLTADHPRFVTQLPGLIPNAVVERGTGRRDPLPLRADTVWIETSRRICTVTWRGTVALNHPAEPGRIVVTMNALDASRAYARHDPALLAMPMNMSDPDGGDTLSISVRGDSRPATPFEPQNIAAPDTMDLNLDDPALAEDDAITFVQTDAAVKTSTLPFVQAPTTGTERTTQLAPPAGRDSALPFAGAGRAPAPSSPALPFVSPTARPSTSSSSDGATMPGAGPPGRDLPFVSPIGPSTKSGSGSFSQHATSPMFPASPPAVAKPAPPPIFSAQPPNVAPSAPPAAVFPVSTPTTAAVSFPVIGGPTSFPASSNAAAPPPPRTDVVPEAPPMIGPLATPEMTARPTVAADRPGSFPAEKPRETAHEPPTLSADEDTIERCAQISASIARRKEDRSKILDAEKLDETRFKSLQTRWTEAITAETSKGKTKLLEKFDDAYVTRLEEERGVIRPEEFAQIVVATERGVSESALQDLGLPATALMRIERVFLRRTMASAELSQRVTRAIDAARDS